MKAFDRLIKILLNRWLLGLLSLSTIIITSGAYWIGLEIENLSQQTQPGLQITRLQRGWFSSEADSRLFIQAPSLAIPELPLQHTVYHGPLPLLDWPRPALTTVNTQLDPGVLQQLQITEPNSEQTPLQIISRFNFDQSMYHTIAVATLELAAPLGTIDYFALSELDGSLYFSAPDRFDTADLTLRHFQLRSQINGFALNLEQLQLAIGQDNSAANHYQLELSTLLASLKLPRQLVQSGKLRLSIKQLNQSALLQLAKPGADTQILALQQLLQFNPKVSLHELFLETSQGKLQARAELTLKGFNLLTLLGPAGLLGAVVQQADAEITVDPALLEALTTPAQVQYWREVGFIELRDEAYHCHIRLYNKQLQINDAQLTLPN